MASTIRLNSELWDAIRRWKICAWYSVVSKRCRVQCRTRSERTGEIRSYGKCKKRKQVRGMDGERRLNKSTQRIEIRSINSANKTKTEICCDCVCVRHLQFWSKFIEFPAVHRSWNIWHGSCGVSNFYSSDIWSTPYMCLGVSCERFGFHCISIKVNSKVNFLGSQRDSFQIAYSMYAQWMPFAIKYATHHFNAILFHSICCFFS